MRERALWEDYQAAYEEAIRRCSSRLAPWYVVPANKKWFRNMAVSRIAVEALEKLNMKYPSAPMDPAKQHGR
jgi:polyphosphate kinase 2 (PPK2 family)